MASEEPDFRQLVSRLKTAHFKSYLLGRGWEEKPSRYVDHIYFEVEADDGCDRYELYLPATAGMPKYQTSMMRVIYKLCGIEDREPGEIASAVFASAIAVDTPAVPARMTCLRVRNSGSTPVRLQIDSPLREHTLLPGESIELNCHVAASGSMEIDRGDAVLTISSSEQR
jgi:hypothetical protein